MKSSEQVNYIKKLLTLRSKGTISSLKRLLLYALDDDDF